MNKYNSRTRLLNKDLHSNGNDVNSDSDMKSVIVGIGEAFEENKKMIDVLQKESETRGEESAETKEKFAKISADLDMLIAMKEQMETIQKQLARPEGGFNSKGIAQTDIDKHKDAFYNGFMRKGNSEPLEQLRTEWQNKASVNIGTGAEGGYAVPEELDRNVIELQRNDSTIRQLASVMTIGTSDYKQLVSLHGAATGWVGETSARTATTTPLLAQVVGVFGELYANPQATQQSLEDLFFDVEAWLAQEVADEFNEAENAAFISGDGTNKPKGFLDYTNVLTTDAGRTFGQLQYIKTGVATLFPATSAAFYDMLIDVVQSLKVKHRGNAVWLSNSLSTGVIRKYKDSENNPLWQPGLQAGQPSSLIGYPLREDEDMPDTGANAYPLVFGDFKRAYKVIDRIGTSTLRDPYTNKPFVGFYTRKRVGGNLVDSDALKLVKCEA